MAEPLHRPRRGAPLPLAAVDPNSNADAPAAGLGPNKPPAASPSPSAATGTGPSAASSRAAFNEVMERRTGWLDGAVGLDPLRRPWSLSADFVPCRPPVLGSGGCATVYRARERRSGHEVAVKVQDLGGGRGAKEEAAAAAAAARPTGGRRPSGRWSCTRPSAIPPSSSSWTPSTPTTTPSRRGAGPLGLMATATATATATGPLRAARSPRRTDGGGTCA